MDKCSVLKIGCGTAVDADFILSGNVLPAVTHCRDLGVTIVGLSDLSSRLLSIFLKLYLKPIREQTASYGHFYLVIYTSWSVLLLFMCVQLLSTTVLFGHRWQSMILNSLKRSNDALLNDSVDFAIL